MELVGILSKVIKENLNIKKILLEYPESTIKKLLDKFSKETDETEDEIKKTISDFERFKAAFDNEDKDIFKHSYDRVKQLVADKSTKQKTKKDLESIAQEFVTKHRGADLQLVKTNIKKYFELKTLFPEQKLFKKDVTDFNPSQLSDLVGKFFSKFNERGENELTKRMTEKFSKDNTDDDPLTIILPRVKRFIRHFELIPLNAKLSAFMTFDEFEHLVDGYTPMGEDEYSLPDIELEDVDIAYEDDNVLIFAPDEKQKCINIRKKHAPDRRWCTSWEGSSNYYYNYRLNQNLTLYYVISKNLPESDVNYAVVVLVDRYGGMRLADGTNSGKYAGAQQIDWDEITIKVPSLQGKKEYLEPKPFSNEDQEKMQRYKSYNLRTDNPLQELGSFEEVELWMELRGPDFSNMSNGAVIFGNLPEELQKKYIGLGTELSGEMVKKLQGSVLSYYISKKKEKILNKLLGELTTTDIEVIKTKEMRPYMKQLKEKYGQELLKEIDKDIESSREMGGTGVHLRYPTDTASKYVSLFGLEGYFESIPNDINVITMENGTNDATAMDLPVSIGRFTELTTLVIDNMIKSLPESIGNCNQLSFLNLSNNSQLDNLPESLSKLTCLEFFSIMGSDPNIRIPEKLEENMTMEGEFWYVHFPEDMKKHCTGIVGF
jgi:hypothetical protein